jgi:hypothetical protein
MMDWVLACVIAGFCAAVYAALVTTAAGAYVRRSRRARRQLAATRNVVMAADPPEREGMRDAA